MKNEIANYRPIASLSKLSLVFERILFRSISKHLQDKLSSHQFGFRKSRSCIIQLLSFFDKIFEWIDSKEKAFAIYLDYSKAFDRVPHSILLKKLRSLGLGGSLLKLIASYLQNRMQQVKIENCQSEECPITSGVPQGSVVGPLFFIAFINDLPENCECVPFLFADDLKLASSSLFELQNDLLSLMKWSEENKLDFNLQKTKLLHFSKSKMQCDNLVLHMGENDIYPTTKSIRVLGVWVSPNLTWTDHINIKIANYKRLAMLRRNLPKMLNPDMKFKLYRIYILPALAYASGVWHPNRGDLKKYKGCSGSVSSGLTIGAHFINFLTNITIYRFLYIFKCRICYCSTSSQWAFMTSPYGIMCVQINTTIIMSSEVTPKIFSCLTTHV